MALHFSGAMPDGSWLGFWHVFLLVRYYALMF